MKTIKDNKFSKNSVNILKGSALAIVLTVIMLIIFSILLTYTAIQENTIKPVIIAVSGISILIGSFISTVKIKKNGIINGGLVGGIYILTLYTISSVLSGNFLLNIYSFIMVVTCVITGIIGGIIGVNI